MPIGFCKKHKIPFHGPPDCKKKEFDIKTYLKENDAIAAPDNLFNKEIHSQSHGFKRNMYLEATDLMDPHLVCPAFVKVFNPYFLSLSIKIDWIYFFLKSKSLVGC